MSAVPANLCKYRENYRKRGNLWLKISKILQKIGRSGRSGNEHFDKGIIGKAHYDAGCVDTGEGRHKRLA